MKTGVAKASRAPSTQANNGPKLSGSDKQRDTRMNNIIAAKAVSDVVRTSLGPRGMDKMVSRVYSKSFAHILLETHLF
jgi:hypothetical protein